MSTEMLVEELKQEVRPAIAPLEAEAEAISIVDQSTYDQACFIAKRAVIARTSIREKLLPAKSSAHAAWKEIVSLENEMLALVTGAERIAKTKIGQWNLKQEDLRRAEQRRLAEEARQREEAEKLEAATAAEAEGASDEEVSAILDEPTPEVAVVAPETFQKSSGISTRETWKGEVVNLQVLIRFVANNPQFTNLMRVDQTVLNSLARSQKQLFNMPGARAVKSVGVAVR